MPKFRGHIQRRHQTWYAVLDIPKDVRPNFDGKPRFVKSLKTHSHKTALMLVGPIVADWKAEIEFARTGDRSASDSLAQHYQAKYLNADSEEAKDKVLSAIADTAADIAHASNIEGETGEDDPRDVASAQEFYDEATGKLIATDAYVEQWLKNEGMSNSPKTIDLKRSAIARLTERLPTLNKISKKEIQLLCQEMLQEQGLASNTVNRELSAWRGYWKYLQSLEVVSEDTQPFVGLSLPKPSSKTTQKKKRLPFDPRHFHF